ncbi:MAG: DoxX family protein [Nonlabens sp.]|uniref:DoxX family protein n=1 Tax=Nonlabens sp. TaxID=1888209 RepID=UPI003EF86BE9
MLFTQEHVPQWSLGRRITFRFIFLFLVGFIFLMPTRFLFSPLLVWMGENIFESTGRLSLESTGSGDDTMSWLSVVLQLFMAVVGTLIWSVVDRKRVSYNKLFYWFRIILRIFLAFFMMVYGFAKVFLVQFNEPSLLELMQPLGDMSPMGLAWTYMGFNPWFQVFTGILEVLAGILLVSRRTQSLGALMVIGIMTHVAVMNLSFDIPVKIFSIHLAIMGLVLFLSDGKRILFAFFSRSKNLLPEDYRPIKPEYDRAIRIIKIVSLIIIVLGVSVLRGAIYLEQSKDNFKDEFYGIWEVETFIKNGDTIPPLTTASQRWRYIVMETKDRSNVKYMNDSIAAYHFKVDSLRTNISIYKRNDDEVIDNFKFIKKDSLQLHFKGILESDSLEIHLKAKDLKDFTLTNRGFHWVNESPFNK